MAKSKQNQHPELWIKSGSSMPGIWDSLIIFGLQRIMAVLPLSLPSVAHIACLLGIAGSASNCCSYLESIHCPTIFSILDYPLKLSLPVSYLWNYWFTKSCIRNTFYSYSPTLELNLIYVFERLWKYFTENTCNNGCIIRTHSIHVFYFHISPYTQ